MYGPATAEVVASFQARRGLRVDGICGRQTWSALVEAGYRLGARLLYHRMPMLRGDDVADLQRRLGAFGFDAGRIDGIFGPQTARALADFQRNAGLTVDGICGPSSVEALRRLSRRGQGGRNDDRAEVVAGLRERDTLLHSPRTLDGRAVVVGRSPGLSAGLAHAVADAVTDRGAKGLVLSGLDGSSQAAEANSIGAHVYLSLVDASHDAPTASTAYYATHGFESAGGRRLAELVQRYLPPVLRVADGGVLGMSLPALRESRMPAVVCELGPAKRLLERQCQLAQAFAESLAAWAASPCD